MPKNKKRLQYILIPAVYGAVVALTFVFGIFENPRFSLYDFFMGFASEILGLVFALYIADKYTKLAAEYKREKSAKGKKAHRNFRRLTRLK